MICPFDVRLARTPYLVLPKLALQTMPMEWREKLEKLLTEMEDAGIRTPSYYVFRNVTVNNDDMIRGVKHVNYLSFGQKPYYVFSGKFDDP